MTNDVEKLLGTLNDPEKEIYWDECWDRLMDVRDASDQAKRSLFKALGGRTAIVRIAAIRKLGQLRIDSVFWASELSSLLADDDHEVRSEAFEAAKAALNSSAEIVAAVKRISEDNSEYLGLRIKAWWCLWRSRNARTA